MTIAVVGNNIINLRMSSNRIAYGPKVIDVKSCAYGNNAEDKCKYSSRLMVGSCHSVKSISLALLIATVPGPRVMKRKIMAIKPSIPGIESK
jgi:exosortase/archaeosortase